MEFRLRQAASIIFLTIALFSVPAMAAKKTKPAASHALQDFSTIRKAIDAAEKNKWQDAEKYANQTGLPLIRKIVKWMEFTAPGEPVSFQEISHFIKQNPDWPLQDVLWQNAENALDDVPAEEIIAWFAKKQPVTRNGMIVLAEAKRKLYQDNPEIRKEVNYLIKQAWAKGNFNSQEEKEFLGKYASVLEEIDYVHRISNMLWQDRLDSAERSMEKISRPYQKLFQARIALMRNKHDALRYIDSVPKELKNDEGLLYNEAQYYYAAKDTKRVRNILENLPKQLDYSDKWGNIRMDQIRTLLSEGNYDLAYKLASKHELDESADYTEIEWMAGWIALRFLDNPDQAYKHFYTLYNNVKMPVSLARAAYWAGRSAEAAGKNDIAKSWYDVGAIYPTTFYGQLASLKVGKNTISFPYPTVPTAGDRKAFDSRELILAFRTLASINQDDMAKKFLIAAIKNAKTAGEMRLISKIGITTGRKEFSVIAAKQAAARGVIFEEESYPILVGAHPEKNTSDFIEPALAHAIIRQESQFSTAAESSVGALGLMQLMPDTARLIAKKINMRFDKHRLTTDPNYNIRIGSAYLGHLIDNYDGSYVLAIAAYNGGQGNVSKWVQMYGDPRNMKNMDNIIDWIEVIPFRETRNYVQRVIESVQVYRYVLNKHLKKGENISPPPINLDRQLRS